MGNPRSEREVLVNEIVTDNMAQPATRNKANESWGWVVVLASFYCIAILDGVGYTTGILLDALLQDLGGGRAEVSLAGSLQVGVYCLSGPIVDVSGSIWCPPSLYCWSLVIKYRTLFCQLCTIIRLVGAWLQCRYGLWLWADVHP